MAFKTPGVYVQEISLFPPSVAEVETAIPAFIGYTEKAVRRGEDLTNKPTKISSLLEYHELFGGPFIIDTVNVSVNQDNNYAVSSVSIVARYYLYESLRLFFDNGGGECYIVSVGAYGDPVALGNEAATDQPGLRVGLKALEKYDEPTILLFPDAVLLAAESDLYTLQQLTLSQCAKLQDRVGVFDLWEQAPNTSLDESVGAFRDGIGINNLKYGAAYTPWVISAFPRTVDFDLFRGNVTDSQGSVDLTNLTSDSDLNALVADANTAIADRAAVKATIDGIMDPSATVKDRYKSLKDAINAAVGDPAKITALNALMGFLRDASTDLAGWSGSLAGANLRRDLATYANSTLVPAGTALIALEKDIAGTPFSTLADATAVETAYQAVTDSGWLDAAGVAAGGTDYTDDGDGGTLPQPATIQAIVADLDALFHASATGNVLAFVEQVRDAAWIHAGLAQTTLYQGHGVIANIVENIKREMSRVPPSGAIAGVYAFVDDARGVWKSPANVSLSSVLAPTVAIDDAEQEDLNVDTTAGKSVNALRAFTGRGTVVWGARTLAGNDNEWRYVSVRRFFNMVEESVKKSTAWAVFEANAAPLWTRLKGMIDNYLIQKWREGALAGATPEDAFFVKIGLGQTMTAQDILEGRLNVEIGMAVVRPAEFIILKFSHKMQES